MIPEYGTLDCENCAYYNRAEEMCQHPDGCYSEECIWKEEE